jgi:hypothetical protein
MATVLITYDIDESDEDDLLLSRCSYAIKTSLSVTAIKEHIVELVGRRYIDRCFVMTMKRPWTWVGEAEDLADTVKQLRRYTKTRKRAVET